MSLINKEVSEFSVKAYQNNAFRTITKDNLLGQWSVFFFYPADFTFVCPTELEDLENHYDAFQKLGCEIYSVSCDTEFVHKAWHDHSGRIAKITYPMVADPTHALARDFEVLIESAGLAERGTFIINPRERLSLMRSMRAMSAAMPRNCCARCRPASSSTSMGMRSALPNGSRAPRP